MQNYCSTQCSDQNTGFIFPSTATLTQNFCGSLSPSTRFDTTLKQSKTTDNHSDISLTYTGVVCAKQTHPFHIEDVLQGLPVKVALCAHLTRNSPFGKKHNVRWVGSPFPLTSVTVSVTSGSLWTFSDSAISVTKDLSVLPPPSTTWGQSPTSW
jgi:hypothetical protein